MDKLVQAILIGATYELAALYAGISGKTFLRWRQEAETARPGTPLAQLRDRLSEAEGKAAVGWLAQIEAAARNGNFQAAAWKLERRYPKEYGRQPLDPDAQAIPDIHVHIHTARERLSTRLEHLAQRHGEDAAGVN